MGNRKEKCATSLVEIHKQGFKRNESFHLSMYRTLFLQVSSSQCANDLQMGEQVLLSNKEKPA